MRQRHVSAEEIRRTLLGRINSGQYAVGSQIPPARTLAMEFGANRNTVSKAFQELARDGFVTLVPGRGGGTFVQRSNTTGEHVLGPLRAELRSLIHQARLMGLDEAGCHEFVSVVIGDVYQSGHFRFAFLECNIHDAHTLVEQLSPLIGHQIDPYLIEQEDLASLGKHYDLVITTFHHLAEVRRELGTLRDKVVGVHAVPTHEAALKIARLEARCFGLVCGRENTVQSMKYLVASYHPDDELLVALVDDVDDVRALVQQSEALIVTYSCVDVVAQIANRAPDVVVEFQVDGQSIEFLRQRIAQLQTNVAD